MKKYIRFKVKDLLKLSGILLLLSAFIYLFLPNIMFSIGTRYADNGELNIAKGYYERIEAYFPNSSINATALMRAAEIVNGSTIAISANSVGSQSYFGFVAEGAEAYYTKIVERFPKTNEGRNAYTLLAASKMKRLIAEDETAEALNLMKTYYSEINEGFSNKFYDYSVVTSAVNALRSKGQLKEALYVLDYYSGIIDYDNLDILELSADINALMGNKAEAEALYHILLEKYQEDIDRDKEHSQQTDAPSNSYYTERKQYIEEKISVLGNEPTSTGRVSGSISLKGEALPAIDVFLQPQEKNNQYRIGSSTGDALWAISNNQGEFSFSYVPPGRYSLGLLVSPQAIGEVVLKGGFFPKSTLYVAEGESYSWDFEFVDTMEVISPNIDTEVTGDAVHFQWSEVEDAAYYTLTLGSYGGALGGTFSNYLDKLFYTNEAILTGKELSYANGALGMDDEGPLPETIMGFGLPGIKYYWSVNAHDENGNIITSSWGYGSENTDFHFPYRELTEGDQLLMDRRLEEAIAAYEAAIAENPSDNYSKAMLAKIYSISDTRGYRHTDFKKALAYYTQLYTNTKDPVFLNHMMNINNEMENYQGALELVDAFSQLNRPNPYHHYLSAKGLSHLGDYSKALEELWKGTADANFDMKAALMLLTDNYTADEAISQGEQVWMKSIKQYQEEYSHLDEALKNTIAELPPLEALKLFDNKDLTPHQALLKLSLELVEPTLKRYSYELLEDWQRSYRTTDPQLSRLVSNMFIGYGY